MMNTPPEYICRKHSKKTARFPDTRVFYHVPYNGVLCDSLLFVADGELIGRDHIFKESDEGLRDS